MSDVSGFHVKDVMDMDLDELIQKYNRTVRAAGLLRYMLEADDGLTEEPEQKTWTLVRQAKYQEFQAWKRHKVWCCLRDARDTRCLLHCPWRPPRLFCALQAFRVLSPDSALVTITVFAALNMPSMSQAMPPQLPPPQYPPQYPVPYQPPQYGQQYVWSVREAHAHQVLRGGPRRVVCHGRGGAERDDHRGGASATPTHGTSANPGGTTA